jgi:head-tail adaptor
MLATDVGTKRHVVTVLLPSTTLDARGQITGAPTTVIEEVPCSIEQLAGLELIRAQKIFAEATHRVRMFADPDSPLTSQHYLLFGARQLNIGAVIDADNIGVEIELLCKEAL